MSQLVRVDETLIDRILDDTHELWHDGLARPAYGRLWRAQLATPWGKRHLTRWALIEDGEVMSSAKLYRFDAVLDGHSIQVAGLGAVFTPRARRGRGAAAELIRRLLEQARGDGCDAALLFSEIGADYYARLGFVTMPLGELTLRVVEDKRRGAPATMIRSGTDRDLADIAAMDAARAEPFRFHLVRDADVSKFAIARKRLLAGLGNAGVRELLFFVAEEGASAVAYIVIESKDGEWLIDSCGDRDPAGARLGAILQVLVAREPAQRRPTIRAWLPATLRPPQIEILGASPSRDIMMWQPLTSRARAAAPLAETDVLYWRGDAF